MDSNVYKVALQVGVETQVSSNIQPIICRIRPFIKNCEESEILPDLKANKLAYHSFIDAGKRHKILGSERNDFVFHAQQIE